MPIGRLAFMFIEGSNNRNLYSLAGNACANQTISHPHPIRKVPTGSGRRELHARFGSLRLFWAEWRRKSSMVNEYYNGDLAPTGGKVLGKGKNMPGLDKEFRRVLDICRSSKIFTTALPAAVIFRTIDNGILGLHCARKAWPLQFRQELFKLLLMRGKDVIRTKHRKDKREKRKISTDL